MYCLKAILFLLVAFFGSFSSPADAQVNLKTGYNFSILSHPGLDQVISAYNELQGYSSEFKNLKWLHGFEVGLRMKSEVHAMELSYQGGYRTLRAEDVSIDKTLTDKMNFSVHSVALGYQASDRIFGLGTDLMFQFYKTKVTSQVDENSFRDFQNMLALRFYGLITLKGGKGVDMAFQPYYILPFKDYDLQPLKNFVIENGSNPGNKKWTRFGISLLFYNGSK